MPLFKSFLEGGPLMFPIFALGLMMITIVLERTLALYFRLSVDKEAFFKKLTSHLLKADFEGMMQVCDENPAPLPKIVKNCLLRLVNKGTDAEIQAALDEGALMEVPAIEKRIGFLAVVGNVSTLLGLLGTITGLISSFAAVANVDPATKAAMLTKGISEAMNCTAFGLLVAIPAVFAYSLLQARAQRLIDDIHEVSIRTFNFVLANRERFGLEQKAA